jgi:Dolichyl-phosphate-mannose-protein mannosyltransferase
VWIGQSPEFRVAFRIGIGRWRDLAVACGLFALAFWHVLSAIDATSFHRDEARWIHRAAYLLALADPLGQQWIEEGLYPGSSLDERFPLRAQPPLGAYLMGLGLLVQGRDLTTNGFWNMDRDDAWNRTHGNVPAPEDLLAGRRTNAVVAALTVVAVYFIGTCLTNRVGGLVAALVLLPHPLLISAASIAGADPLLILLVALAALAAYRLAERPTWERALLLGGVLGLGGATKLSPLLVALLLAGLGAPAPG